MRIHELAKKYSVSSEELIKLLQNAGYEVTTHMSSVGFDMLDALERHFNWTTPAKKKTKAKAKAKAKKKATATATTEDEAKARPGIKGKARLKTKARLKPKETKEAAPAEADTPEDEAKATDVEKKTGAKAKTKTKAKAKAKAKAKTKTKAKEETTAEAAKEKPVAVVEPEPAAAPTVEDKPAPAEKPKMSAATARALEKPKAGRLVRAAEKPKEVKPAPVAKKPAPPEPVEVKPPAEKAPPAEKPKKGEKRPKKGHKEAKADHKRKQRVKKTPAELDAQKKAVRESVRRTLAKLETTRKTKRRKSKGPGEDDIDVKPVQVQDKSNVGLLADSLGVSVDDILECCEEMGVAATANQELDRDVIELISEAMGRTVEIEAVYGEARLKEEASIDPEKLESRSPIVTVMGHVDHGKTSILDHVRKTNVAAGEAGGITQHIGAYEVETSNGKITFIDTPGHEAFTSMRSRGAQLTDIVVLVVAADDGVMPQTIEAINHTHSAGVPMVVAINKMDVPGANPDNVKQQLSQHGVLVEGFGGDVVEAQVSAKTGDGIDKLLEMIVLQSELQELKADPTARAQGVVVEAKKEEGRGIICTVLIQQGTLKVGDVFVVGSESGKVRSLLDHRGKNIKKAGPSNPVQILGFNGVPEAGDSFIAVKNEKEAREVSAKRQDALKYREMQPAKALTLEDLYAQIQQGDVKELGIIVKGDTDGSVEALRDSLSPMVIEEVQVKIVHSAVGTVSESDVVLAVSSNAVIIAFNTGIAPKAKSLAKLKGIEVRRYSVIYEAVEDIDEAMKGMLEPEIIERVLGKAEVRQVFRASRLGTVAGSMVVEGVIERNASARVYRGEDVVFEGKIESLKRFKDDVKEVAENFECGIGLSGYDNIEVSDVIEAFVVEEKARIV